MSLKVREVYIISDLHIGGREPDPAQPNDHGFRMNTNVRALASFVDMLAQRCAGGAHIELIINGDFVDFLAEEDPVKETFEPFMENPRKAIQRLDQIVNRDQVLFESMKAFCSRGGWLTMLLGNHDIELALPHVRGKLIEHLGWNASPRMTFLYDGEAYAVGDALIEHGNRYDGFNVVDHDGLRKLRSCQSRGQFDVKGLFSPPPGSRLVATVMNPIKKFYSFVDLLKPETKAVIPILLALEPGYRDRILELWPLKAEAIQHGPKAPGVPRNKGDLAARGWVQDTEGNTSPEGKELDALLKEVMRSEAGARYAKSLKAAPKGGDLSSFSKTHASLGFAKLLTSRDPSAWEERLPVLLDVLRRLQKDRSFDRGYETEPAYSEAATDFVKRGFRYVVFGHTHLAKNVKLSEGGMYFNSGTWANLISVPQAIVDPDNPHAIEELRTFVADLKAGRLSAWIKFQPTYVRLEFDVAQNRVLQAALCDFAADR